jgi:hypothetical protein
VNPAERSGPSRDDPDVRPVSRFEAWTRGSLTGISSLRVAPPWVRALALMLMVALVVAFGALRSGPIRGGLVFVGLWGVVLLFLRSWLIAAARTRNYLVTRADWGVNVRFAMLASVVILTPIAAAVVAYAGISLLGMLDRFARGG